MSKRQQTYDDGDTVFQIGILTLPKGRFIVVNLTSKTTGHSDGIVLTPERASSLVADLQWAINKAVE